MSRPGCLADVGDLDLVNADAAFDVTLGGSKASVHTQELALIGCAHAAFGRHRERPVVPSWLSIVKQVVPDQPGLAWWRRSPDYVCFDAAGREHVATGERKVAVRDRS